MIASDTYRPTGCGAADVVGKSNVESNHDVEIAAQKDMMGLQIISIVPVSNIESGFWNRRKEGDNK